VICPNHNGPICTTCRLGGLVRCPVLGVPLPLVENERPHVTYKHLSESEALRIWRWMSDNRRD